MSDDKTGEQIDDIAAADRSEWKRTVEENQDLQRDLRALREKYGMPFGGAGGPVELDGRLRDYTSWVNQDSERYESFKDDVAALCQRHQIRDEWRASIRYKIAVDHYMSLSMGDHQPKPTEGEDTAQSREAEQKL